MSLNEILNSQTSTDDETFHPEAGLIMPALFVGHGSPMNTLEDNSFTRAWAAQAHKIPTKPKAILVVSAHWETKGTKVTAMEKPRTIHDFRGFPRALNEFQYPASGSPLWAKATKDLVQTTKVEEDLQWGLDHGCWSVLAHLFPKADVPVFQLSIDYTQPLSYHLDLGKELQALRKKGVLIIGSGNIVHNLGMLDWAKGNTEFGYDWALEARATINQHLLSGDTKALADVGSKPQVFKLAIPTPEHYIPLLYIAALRGEKDQIQLFNDAPVMGSITMTSVYLGS